jgi:hypothetical protein
LSDHVWADIVQEVINVERLTLVKYRGVPLKIGCVHDTLVVQPKELHRGIVEKKLVVVFQNDKVRNNGPIDILKSRIACSIIQLNAEFQFEDKQKSSYFRGHKILRSCIWVCPQYDEPLEVIDSAYFQCLFPVLFIFPFEIKKL